MVAGGRNVGLAKVTANAGKSLAHNPMQFHATPPEGTLVLEQQEGRRIRALSRRLWLPACGAGDMAEVFRALGYLVHATDLIDRGYGRPGVDFLKQQQLLAPVIVENPPFGDTACAFIRHAAKLRALYLALLLPAGFFHSVVKSDRDALWRDLPPSRVWPLGFRLDFTGAGSPPAMPLCWFVWDWSFGLSRQHDRQFNEPYARLMPPVRRPVLADFLEGGRS